MTEYVWHEWGRLQDPIWVKELKADLHFDLQKLISDVVKRP